MSPLGSRAPYANARNEQVMRSNLASNDKFSSWGPTSTAWVHKKQLQIQRGQEWNVARDIRIAQENRYNSRIDEERQISDLTAGRRPGLIGHSGQVRAAQRAAEQVINSMK